MKRKHLYLLAAVVFLLIIVSAVYLLVLRKNSAEYRVIKPLNETIENTIMASAVITPRVGAYINVGSRISGTVMKLSVKVGNYVQKNQIIAVIDHREMDEMIRQIEAQIQSKKLLIKQTKKEKIMDIDDIDSKLKQSQNVLSYAKSNFIRMKTLFEKGFISKDDFSKKKTDYENDIIEVKNNEKMLHNKIQYYNYKLKSLKSDLISLKAKLKQQLIQRSYAFIRAPISGYIAEVNTQQGETVASSFNTPTFVKIIDLNRLKCRALVDDSDISQVKVGDRVYFIPDAYPLKKISAKVEKIYPDGTVIDGVTYYYVDCTILNNDVHLKPQMNVNAYIITGIHRNTIVLPADAVKFQGRNTYVFIKKKGKIIRKRVKTGFENEGKIEILSGITNKDNIVIYE